MSLVLAVNVRNDLYLASDGNVARASGLAAVMQAAQQAAQTILGEMIYAVDAGLPNFQAIWNGAPNLSQFEAYLRRTLLAVENVTDVAELEISVADNAVKYRAVIVTVYGTGEINV